MHIAVVGLSHRTAPVEVRERLSIPEQTMETSLQSLKGNEQVLEASILSTCNRLEIYTLVRNPELGVGAVRDFLSGHSGLDTGELSPHLFSYHHEDAVDHLMRVSAGLDSLVLGEGQILSQVKKMMRLGQEHKSLGPILNRLLTQAVSTGKRVRSETNLGTGAVSISSAAVELAQLKVGQSRGLDQLVSLESEQIAVIGAGRMSRLLLQHLKAKGAASVALLNRTVERAELLAKDFPDLPVQCRPLTDLDQFLSTCSLVFTSTAADEPIIDAARLLPLNRRSRLRLIDIGVPRNIAADVTSVEGVDSHEYDLQEVVARNQEAPSPSFAAEESAAGGAAILDCGTAGSRADDQSTADLDGNHSYGGTAKALSRMGPDFSARERKVVEALSKGIVNKILHTPVTQLRAPQARQERQQALQTVERLFDLERS